MEWSQIITTSAITTGLLSVIGVIGQKWLETQITEKIKSENEKVIEKYKEQIKWESTEEKRRQPWLRYFHSGTRTTTTRPTM